MNCKSFVYNKYMKNYRPNSNYHKKITIDKTDQTQCQICGLSFEGKRKGTAIANHIKLNHNLTYEYYMLNYFNVKTNSLLNRERMNKEIKK